MMTVLLVHHRGDCIIIMIMEILGWQEEKVRREFAAVNGLAISWRMVSQTTTKSRLTCEPGLVGLLHSGMTCWKPNNNVDVNQS